MAKAVKPSAKKSAAPKKAAPKKAAPEKKTVKPAPAKSETGLKYADKSGDQPELVPIFEAIKKLLLPYGKGTIKVRGGTGGQVTLVSEKPVEINGRKRDEFWFAAALIQRGYVGFYFMPVHDKNEVKEFFKPELLKCLKGKSCFHIKKADEVILKQIEESLAKGYLLHRKRGWI